MGQSFRSLETQGNVHNLTSIRDPRRHSVTLLWDEPNNPKLSGDVIAYNIRYKSSDSWWVTSYHKITVDAPTTTVVLTKESGFNSLLVYDFEVRPQYTHCVGEWSRISEYKVENLTVVADTHKASVTLKWDPPANAGDVTMYDIRYKNWQLTTVNAPSSSVIISLENDLIPNVTYDFEIRARSAECKGEWSRVSKYTVPNLAASVDSQKPSVTLKWDSPVNAGYPGDVYKYQVRFWDKERNCYNESTVNGSRTTTVITRESGLRPLTDTTFEVKACTCDDASQEWRSVSTFIALTPGSVQNLTATLDSHKPCVILKWDPPVNAGYPGDVTKYQVCFWDKGRSCYNESTVDGSTTTTVITRESGLRPLTETTFEVRACSGDSVSQKWRTATTFVALTPGPVQNLTAAVDSHKPSVTLKWDPPVNAGYPGDVTKYQVRFWDKERSCFNEKTVDGSTTTTVITRESGLRALTETTFAVRACSGDDVGQTWRTATSLVALIPDLVENLKAIVDSHKPCVTLKWDPPANAGYPGDVTKYQVRFWDKERSCYNEKIVDGSTTTTVITRESGLRPLTDTTFEVRACSGDDVSQEWRTVTTFVALVPGHVENLRSNRDPNRHSVTLHWDEPNNCELAEEVTAYEIRFRPSGWWIGDYKTSTVNAPFTSILLTGKSGFNSLLSYDFEVRARNAFCEGEWSRVSEYTVQNLTAIVDTHKASVMLKWDAPVNAGEVQTYDIRYRPSKSWWITPYHRTTVKTPATQVLLTREDGLKLFLTYDFEVTARNTDFVGQWIRVSKYMALIPDPVENLKATVDSHKPCVTLKWDPPANAGYPGDVTKYQVLFWNKEKSCYSEEIVNGSRTTTIITRESGLRPLTETTFEVRACSGDDFSQEWRTVTTFVALIPDLVENLKAIVDSHKPCVTLKWDPPANAGYPGDVTKYQVRFWDKERSCYNEKIVDGSTTTTVITRESGLRPLTDTTFEVRACSGDAVSQEWRTVTTFVALVPGHVENLRSNRDPNRHSVTLHWDEPNNCELAEEVTAYEIRFRPSGWWIRDCKTSTVNAPLTSILLTGKSGFNSLHSYDFEVRARNAFCEGEWSRVSEYTVQNLTAIVDTHKASVMLKWDAPVNARDVKTYDIRYRPSKRWWITPYHRTTVKTPATQVLLTKEDGLKLFLTYDFEVRARNADFVGQWIRVSKYMALIPDPVENLKATVDSHKPCVTLKWDPPANAGYPGDVTKYQVRFWNKEKSCYSEEIVNGSRTTTIITRESGLRPLFDTTFAVRACSGDDVSQEWRTATIFVALTPDPVQNLTAAVDTHKPSVTLKWDPPANAGYPGDVTKYQVRFWNKEKSCGSEEIVNGSRTTTVVTRESGLRPLTETTFEVRACSGDDVSQEWRTATPFIALTPDPVQNLTAAVDSHKPSVTLKWDPPANAGYPGDVTKYQVRFWNKEKSCYSEEIVNGSRTTTVITRESGLRPLTETTFEVRACSGDDVSQKWRTVSAFLDMNLTATVDTHKPSVMLRWDPPENAGEVQTYDIRYRPSESWWITPYHRTTVKTPATQVFLTREDGLKLFVTYDFEVRARNADYVGQWIKLSKCMAPNPDPFEKITATGDSHKPCMTLKWDPLANAGYQGDVTNNLIENLKATVDSHKPCVTLKWDQPANLRHPGDVTNYQVRFWDKERSCYNDKTVNGSTTTTVITRESGLRPLTETTFEVRACTCDDISQEWRTVTTFVALTPDPVQNLTATLDSHKPSVTLKWDPPVNAGNVGDVTKYLVHFWNKGCYNESSVDGSTTTTVITRESGLRPLATSTFEVRACSGDDVSQKWMKVSTFVALTPDPVQNLTAAVDSHKPSVTLKWDPPANAGYPGDVTEYQVRFWDKKNWYNVKRVNLNGSTTTTVITRESGLRPLATSTFEVRACSDYGVSQKWTTVSTFVAIVPDTVENLKVQVDSNIPSATLTWDPPHNCIVGTQSTCSDVSSYHIRFKQERQEYNEVNVNGDTTSIVFSEESGLSLHATFTFEVRAQSGDKLGEWKAVSAFIELIGVMKLDSRSQEYIDLCDKFQKDWAMNKGSCPSIIAIVKIVNSIVSLRFEDYPLKLHGIEQHYHGTALCCDLANSANLCNDPDCGVCGITRRGFDPLRIGSGRWQRFGKGFYFAPNSSKAYDYAIGNRFGANRIATRYTRYSAIILCDIAPGRKYTTKFNSLNLVGPPTGYNSVHGESGEDLIYDEIVVYDSRAICPQYIIFCRK